MPDDITAIELIESGAYALGERFEESYVVHGTDDTTVAVELGPEIGTQGPGGVVLARKRTERIGESPPACRLICEYEAPPPAPETELTIDMMAETMHVETALSQTHYGQEGVIADHPLGLLINVSENGVGGVDIHAPRQSWQVSRGAPLSDQPLRLFTGGVTSDYIRTLRNSVGAVNSDAIAGLDPGEALFLGARMTKRGSDAWTIRYHIANSQNHVYGPGELHPDITCPIPKKGWDYVWFTHVERLVTVGGMSHRCRSIREVHVATVYPSVKFGALRIFG